MAHAGAFLAMLVAVGGLWHALPVFFATWPQEGLPGTEGGISDRPAFPVLGADGAGSIAVGTGTCTSGVAGPGVRSSWAVTMPLRSSADGTRAAGRRSWPAAE